MVITVASAMAGMSPRQITTIWFRMSAALPGTADLCRKRDAFSKFVEFAFGSFPILPLGFLDYPQDG